MSNLTRLKQKIFGASVRRLALLGVIVLLVSWPLGGLGAAKPKNLGDKLFEKLKAQLETGTPAERALAARRLPDSEDHGNRAALSLGQALATEKMSFVASDIIKSLAKIGGPVAYKHLHSAMKKSREADVRGAIVMATGPLSDKALEEDSALLKPVEAIWELAAKDTADVQRKLLKVLNKKAWMYGQTHIVRIARFSKTPQVRADAVRIIGQANDGEMEEFVKKYFKDRAQEVRIQVIDSVMQKRPEPTAKNLARSGLKDRVAAVRQRVLAYLGRHYRGDLEIILELQKFLPREADANTQAKAIRVLGLIDTSPKSERLFIRFSANSSDRIRAEAVLQLSAYHSSRTIRALRKLGRDKSVSVRLLVIKSLVEIGSPKASEAIATLLTDKESDVNRDALVALGTLGDRRAVAKIRVSMNQASSLKGSKAKVRLIRSLKTLEKIGGEAAAVIGLDPLLSQHKDHGIRKLAAALVAQNPPVRQAHAIIAWFKREKDVSTRILLIQCLGRLKRQEAETVLVNGLIDADTGIVKATVKALEGATNPNIVEGLKVIARRPELVVPLSKTLASLRQPAAAELLDRFRTNSRTKVRIAALNGLGLIPFDEDQRDTYVDILIKHIGTMRGNVHEVDAVYGALGRLGGERATTFLAGRNHTTAIRRKAALAALAKLDPEKATATAKKLIRGTDVTLRYAAYATLSQIGEPEGLALLIRRLGKKAQSAERIRIIEAISHYRNSEEAAAALQKVFANPKISNDETKAAVLAGLGRIGLSGEDDAIERLILNQLENEDSVRISLSAIRASANFKNKDVIPVLIALLESDNKRIHAEARLALEFITNFSFGRYDQAWPAWWEQAQEIPIGKIVSLGFRTHGYREITNTTEDEANRTTLIKALRGFEPCCRYNAIRALKKMTGETHGFDYRPLYDAAGVRAWRADNK